MTNPLVRNDQMVQSLSQAVHRAGEGFKSVPGLLRSILEQDMWRERMVSMTGEIVRFERFEDFVAAYPPEGLGASMDVLKSICKEYASDLTNELLRVSSPANHQGRPSNDEKQRNTWFSHNDTAEGKLARLKRDHPDLAEQVIEGELSAHAAAVQAGFANPKVSINLAHLDSAARTIMRKLDRDEVLELIDWLYTYLSEDNSPG